MGLPGSSGLFWVGLALVPGPALRQAHVDPWADLFLQGSPVFHPSVGDLLFDFILIHPLARHFSYWEFRIELLSCGCR